MLDDDEMNLILADIVTDADEKEPWQRYQLAPLGREYEKNHPHRGMFKGLN